MKQQYKEIIERTYAAFNARDIDAVLSKMHPEVHWPNGWEGGYVTGHKEVRDYWTRQWKEINPKVEPVSIIEKEDEQIEVRVRQIVKDLSGTILFEGFVKHVYATDNGLIKSMEIEK